MSAATITSNERFTPSRRRPGSARAPRTAAAPCPGTYSPRSTSRSVVRGAMRTRIPRRCAASTISSSCSSPRPLSATSSSSSRSRASVAVSSGPGVELADEVVVDAAARGAERLAQPRHLLRVADEQRAPAHAHRAQERAGHGLVAPAEEADQHRDEDGRRDVEAERREVLAGADRERERERGDEHAPTGRSGRRPRAPRAARRGGCARRRARAAGTGTAASRTPGPRAGSRGSASGRRAPTAARARGRGRSSRPTRSTSTSEATLIVRRTNVVSGPRLST